jgi:hypothetical protein
VHNPHVITIFVCDRTALLSAAWTRSYVFNVSVLR